MHVRNVRLALPIQSDFAVALATIHWSTFAGLKRYFGVLATLGAHGGEHLPLGPIAVATVSSLVCLPSLAT